MRTAGLVIRYLVAAGAAWVLYPLQAAVLYVLLWIVAVVTNQDLGGPLAGPFMVTLAGALGLLLVVVVVIPSVAFGELVARRRRWGWSVPAALASELLLTCGLAGAWALVARASVTDGVIAWAITAGTSLVPLTAAGLIVAAVSTAPKAARWGMQGLREVIHRI